MECLESTFIFFRAKGRQKIPSTGILTRKKQSLQHRENPQQGDFFEIINLSSTGEKSPAQELFFEIINLSSIEKKSPAQGCFWYNQSLHTQGTLKNFKVPTPQHRAHTQGNFEKFQSLHTTAQSLHTGELGKVSNSPHHSTESTHRGTLKIFKVSTHRGISRKNQSPQYKEFFVKNQSLHHRRPLDRPKKINVVSGSLHK